jgi:hypothetical protein
MSARNRVQRIAEKAEEKLKASAPLLLSIVRRRFLLVGVDPDESLRERVALAKAWTILERVAKSALAKAVSDVLDTEGRRAELTAEIATEERAAAIAAIDAAQTVALAAVVAMGLSAARVATLTAILKAFRDSSVDAARATANGCDNRSSRKVLNRAQAEIEKRADEIINRLRDDEKAIAREVERLGIRI